MNVMRVRWMTVYHLITITCLLATIACTSHRPALSGPGRSTRPPHQKSRRANNEVVDEIQRRSVSQDVH